MTEDPTQRIYRPDNRSRYAADAPTTAMPGPLNLAGAPDDTAADSSTTDVLSLDELFEGPGSASPAGPAVPASPAVAAAPVAPPTGETAPTWTAMPVVPVRSEPMTPAPVAPARPSATGPAGTRPAARSRLRSDAAAAWDDTVRHTRAWLGRDDNALMLLTALVAVCLILAVAAFAR
jgi:hypothetical protein